MKRDRLMSRNIQDLLDIKKTIIISVFFHIIVLGISPFLNPFRYRKIYWSIEPIELVPLPSVSHLIKKSVKEHEEKIIISSKKKPVVKKQQKKPKKEILKKKKEEPTALPKEEKAQRGAQPTSGVVSIKGKKFPFAYYLEFLQNKINQAWQPPCNIMEDKKVIIYFKIFRDGQVKNISLEESSGIFLLDQSALRAIWTSAPFPPLPQEFREDSLNVHFRFELKL